MLLKLNTWQKQKVFKQYYKSRIAEDTIRRQSEIYRNYIVAERDKLQALEKEIAKARDAAQNLALSSEVRDAQKSLQETRERDLASRTAALRRYMAERNQLLSAAERDKREEILKDIQAEVARQAASAGYTFVLDSAGKTTAGLPAVLYAHPGADLTNRVLERLNATATPPAETK